MTHCIWVYGVMHRLLAAHPTWHEPLRASINQPTCWERAGPLLLVGGRVLLQLQWLAGIPVDGATRDILLLRRPTVTSYPLRRFSDGK